jgi:hypothetical protein
VSEFIRHAFWTRTDCTALERQPRVADTGRTFAFQEIEMTQEAPVVHNPFALMLEPEVVLAAMEKSERLSRLNRHLCRPLDRPVIPTAAKAGRGNLIVVTDDSDDVALSAD